METIMPGYHDSIKQHRRLCSFSLSAIEEYFSQLNPIAKRIAYDINDTKANYGQLWNTLDYHEQNDIINDSLIKPEISLHYFDHFLTPTPTNYSDSSYKSSSDSLTAIVLTDVGASEDNAMDQTALGKKNNISLKSYSVKLNTHGIKNVYSYDGRNLHTFGKQKLGLKVIQDDVLGCFRDEHSRPFCYRTKSQINLFVLPTIEEPMAARKGFLSNIITTTKPPHENISNDEERKKVLDNYKRLQHQIKNNLKEKNSQDLQNLSLSYTPIKPSSISTNRKNLKLLDASYKIECKDKMTTVSKNTKSSMLQNYINSTQLNATPKIGMNYAVFSDAFNNVEESSNLLQHCVQSDLTLGSCSSVATSDDEKTLEEEDARLLDSDANIRKGFDFLNNW